MMIGRIQGCTHNIGKSQGYRELPVKIEIIKDVPHMSTAWLPTPDEIARIVAGAPIIMTLLCNQHPPCHVSVGSIPD